MKLLNESYGNRARISIINKRGSPHVTVPFVIIQYAKNRGYSPLSRTLDGGYYTCPGKLYFTYNEEYYRDPSFNRLEYRIYNEKRIVVGGRDKNGAAIGSTFSPILTVKKGMNKYGVNVSWLGAGHGYYVLEVTSPKNEKSFLRFYR